MMRQQGFSLVELIVTIAVLVSVSLLAVPAFQTSIGNAQIRTVTESIRHGLQQARVEAIKRNARIQFTLHADSAWQVGCESVTASCPAVISQKSAQEGGAEQVSVVANANTALFTGFGTRDPAVASALSQVDISHPYVAASERKALRVLLAAGGHVRVCDPAVTTAGDIRKC